MVAQAEADNSSQVQGSRSQPILQRPNLTEVGSLQLSKSESALLPHHSLLGESSSWNESVAPYPHNTQVANLLVMLWLRRWFLTKVAFKSTTVVCTLSVPLCRMNF